MAQPEKKPWGETTPVYQDQYSHIDQLRIVPGGYSSRHLHRNKANVFIVHSGSLLVRTFHSEFHIKADSKHIKFYDMQLHPGDVPVIIPAGVGHQFIADSEEVLVTEVYTMMPPATHWKWEVGEIVPAIDRFDIVRFSENGVLEEYRV